VQAGETALHVAVRHCHFNVTDKILKFMTKKQSRYDLVMLVNEQNDVSPVCRIDLLFIRGDSPTDYRVTRVVGYVGNAAKWTELPSKTVTSYNVVKQ